MKCYLEIRLIKTGVALFQRPVESQLEAEMITDDFFAIGSSSEGIEFLYVSYDDNGDEIDSIGCA